MNIKPIVRIQCHSYFSVFKVVYSIFYSIVLISLLSKYLYGGGNSKGSTFSGVELTALITIFIIGIVFFRSSFRFYASNGVSRSRMFVGLLASFGVMAAATALLDSVNELIFSAFSPYHSLYAQLLGTNAPSLSYYANNFLWNLCSCFAAAMFGLLLATLFYRLTRTQRMVFSAGIAVLLLIGLPFLDRTFAAGQIRRAAANAFHVWTNWGLNPLSDLVSRLLLSAVLSGLIFLLIRRADVQRE